MNGAEVVEGYAMTGGMEKSAEGVWPESMGGGGVGEGETVLGDVGEGGERSLTQGEIRKKR